MLIKDSICAKWAIGGTSHQPNYPLWLPLLLVAFTVYSFQGTAQQGAEWGLIKAINLLFSTAFEATFDKLQLIRTTLISKMIKSYKTNKLWSY